MRASGLAVACIWILAASVASAEEISAPAPRVPAGAWAQCLESHPRLLGPRERLIERSKARPDVYARIKADTSLTAAGIVEAVEGLDAAGKDAFIAKARAHVARGVTNTHQDTWIAMSEVAETFDYFHDAIPAADRSAMVEWLNAHLDKYTEDELAWHNSTLSKTLAYVKIAYATWDENPRAKDFRDYALVKLYEGRVLPVLLEFGGGGGYTECGWYTRHSLWHLVYALELARRIEGYDGFARAPRFFYQRLAYEILQPYPGAWTYGSDRYACEGDGSLVYGGSNEYPRLMRALLAQYFSGTDLARFTSAKWRGAGNTMARIMDFMLEEDRDEPLPLADFPLAHFATGIGKVYARGDWTDDASWLRFECGDYWNGHQHFEVGNFEIFRYEPLATESGEYIDYGSDHSVNWLLRTVAHNCILVSMPGETWPMLRDGGRHEYANDGGQTKKWEWTVATIDQWQAKRADFERGDITAYENRPEFLFVAGDCTRAYNPAKMKSWVRQIVFVRPHTFVVYDRVESAEPEYAKAWLLHSKNEPDLAEGAFTIADGSGALSARMLLPRGAKMEKIHGYTYGGRTFDEAESAQTPAAAKWRVEVAPPAAAREDVFLAVLSTAGPVEARLIERDGAVGAAFGDCEVLFKGPVGGTLKAAGKEFVLEGAVKPGKYDE